MKQGWSGMEGKGKQANSDAILQYASCSRQLWLPEYVESWSKFAIGELKKYLIMFCSLSEAGQQK